MEITELMKKIISTLLIIGIVFLPACYATKEPNHLPNKDSNEAGIYIEFFKQGASKPDFNNISGEIGVAIRNIPEDVNKVFVYCRFPSGLLKFKDAVAIKSKDVGLSIGPFVPIAMLGVSPVFVSNSKFTKEISLRSTLSIAALAR